MATDPIVEAVRADLAERSQRGQQTYGTTLAANPLPATAWVQHAYEEALDLALYLRRLREEMEGKAPACWASRLARAEGNSNHG